MRWPILLLLVVAACDEPAKRREEAVALGAAYPEGTKGVGLLVDMLDDDDASVREAAEQALVALGRKGLADLARYLNDPKEPSRATFLETGDILARLGTAVTPADFCVPMAASEPAIGRRAAAAGAALAACWDGRDVMIEILTAVREDPDKGVSATASASLAILGWSAVASKRPASAAEVKDLVPLIGDPSSEVGWSSYVAAGLVVLLRPRAEWPEHVAGYPCAYEELQPVPDTKPMDQLRRQLASLADSAPGRTDDWKRRTELENALRAVRSRKGDAAAAKPELERLLAKERGIGRVSVAKALLAAAPAETEPVARALGETLDPSDRWAAAEALALLTRMGPAARPAVPSLVQMLAWPEKEDAADSGDPAGASARLGASYQPGLKRVAASILGHLGAKDAIPALAELASHGDARLRYVAATALRRIGTG